VDGFGASASNRMARAGMGQSGGLSLLPLACAAERGSTLTRRAAAIACCFVRCQPGGPTKHKGESLGNGAQSNPEGYGAGARGDAGVGGGPLDDSSGSADRTGNLGATALFLIRVQGLLEIFGYLLLVLIGVELLETLKAYLKKDVIHVRVVLEVALIAMARKVIIEEPNTVPGLTLFGIAALILALGIAFYFERQAPKHSGQSGNTSVD
jgi:uncharacterized membrane protein (DUF373 family)